MFLLKGRPALCCQNLLSAIKRLCSSAVERNDKLAVEMAVPIALIQALSGLLALTFHGKSALL